MKKYIYITGIASANLLFIGAMCKVMHWPGAGILLTLSIFIFSFCFLPFALYNAYQNSTPKKYKLLYIVSYIVFAFVFVGALFKIMHWPGASWLLIIGIPLPMVLFLPVYLIQTRKDKKYSVTNFMGILFGLTFLAVFSSMLSINVSSSILKHFEGQFKYNEHLITTIDTRLKNNTNDNNVHEKAEDIYQIIEQLKNQLLVGSSNDVIDIQNATIINLDNYKIPKQVLHNGENREVLVELKNKIIDFKQAVASSKSVNNEIKELSANILDVDDKFKHGAEKISWEDYYFSNYNLIVVLDKLSRMERNVKFVEYELNDY
jgi:hypothetical protein